MEALGRAAIGWLLMVTGGLLLRWVWPNDLSIAPALLFALELPVVVAVVLPLPRYRWPSIAATSAGTALGLGLGVAIQYGSSDSRGAMGWLAAGVWVLTMFPVCCGAGAVAKGVSGLRSSHDLDAG